MLWLSIAGAVFLIWLVLVFLFTPGINYHLSQRTSVHDDDFLYTIQSTCQAALHHGNRVTIFTNGPQFYPAMLEAIRGATRSINMECYIFQPGRIADQFIDALSRARARRRQRDDRRRRDRQLQPVGPAGRAGCARPAAASSRTSALRWYSLARLNNRTHRELLIVDGRVAFAGGAGIADWWALPAAAASRPWRDTMARIEGPVVAALQGVAAENWLECCGEILTGPEYFPDLEPVGRHDGVRRQELAVGSRDRVARDVSAADGGRRSRRPHQHAVLPARPRAAPRARRDSRGAASTIRSSCPGAPPISGGCGSPAGGCGDELLEAGVRIYEYRGAMTHAKVLIVDGMWAVLGTTNIDNRSFEHNDEVNVAMRDAAVAARLLEDYERDLADSDEITLERWQRRPLWEKIVGPFVWILERQQ